MLPSHSRDCLRGFAVGSGLVPNLLESTVNLISIPRAPGAQSPCERLQGQWVEGSCRSEKVRASWVWAGHHPQCPGRSSSGLQWAACRVQEDQVGHCKEFSGTGGNRDPRPASCCQEGQGLGCQSLRLLGRRKSMFVHGMSTV